MKKSLRTTFGSISIFLFSLILSGCGAAAVAPVPATDGFGGTLQYMTTRPGAAETQALQLESKEDIEKAMAMIETTEAKLVFVSPEPGRENVQGKQPVTFLWDQQMFPLAAPEALQQWAQEHIMIEPPMPGAWQVLGTQGLLFEPKEPWPRSTATDITLPGSITRGDAHVHSFSTPRIRMLFSGKNHTQQLFKRDPLKVRFNQPITLPEAQKLWTSPSLQFDLVHGTATEYGDEGTETQVINRSLVHFIPQMDWPANTTYTLNMPKDVRGAEGPLTAGTAQTGSFITRKDIEMTCRTNGGVYDHQHMNFNNKVRSADLWDSLQLDPPVEAEAWAEYIEHQKKKSQEWTTRMNLSPQNLMPKGHFEPHVNYTLSLEKPLTDAFEQVLNPPQKCTFTTVFPNRVSRVYFPYTAQVVERNMPLEYAVRYSGTINEASVTLTKTLPDAQRVTATMPVDMPPSLDAEQIVRISPQAFFTEMLMDDEGMQPGKYTLEMEARWGENNRQQQRFSTVFYVSDFAVEMKINANKTYDISPKQIRNDLPKGPFNVFMAHDINLKTSTVTDIAPLEAPVSNFPHTLTLPGGVRMSDVWMEADGKYGFGSPNFTASMPVHGAGVSFNTSPYQYEAKGKTVTDRPLYKPGDTIHFATMLRPKQLFAPAFPYGNSDVLNGRTVKITVVDAHYKEVFSGEKTIQNGQVDGRWNIPTDAAFGRYKVMVQLLNEDKQNTIVTQEFFVTQYRKPLFLLEAKSPQKRIIEGESLQIDLSAEYAFGGAVADADVKYTVSLYGRTQCHWYWSCKSKDRPIAQGAAKLNDQGEWTLDLPVNIDLEDDASQTHWQMINVYLTVQSSADEQSSTSMSFPFSRSAYDITLQTDKQAYKAKTPLGISGTVMNILTENPADTAVKLTLERQDWIANKHKNGQGRYTNNWEMVYAPVAETTVQTDADGAWSWTTTAPEESASYRIKAQATDDAGRVSVKGRGIWVMSKKRNKNIRTEDQNDILSLYSDKPQYTVGDEIDLFVPVQDFTVERAVATLERGSVLGDLTVQDVGAQVSFVAEPWMAPNVYATVLLEGKDEQGAPAVRWGTILVPVTDLARTIDVTITPQKDVWRPADTAVLTIDTNIQNQGTSTDLIIAVVDKSLLALKARDNKPLQDFFLEPLPLGVKTTHTMANYTSAVDMEMLESQLRALEAPTAENLAMADASMLMSAADRSGGGGGGGASAKVPEFKPRGNFKDTAAFITTAKTNANGTLDVEIPLPENLTKWDVWVLAHTPDNRFGEASSSLQVTLPLLAEPVLPNVFRAGDETFVGVLINRNATANQPETEPITVTFTPPEGMTALAETTQTVTVGTTAQAVFPVEIAYDMQERPGDESSLSVRFDIESATGLKDAVQVSRPWIPPHMASTGAGLYYVQDTKATVLLQTDARSLDSQIRTKTYTSLLHSMEELVDTTRETNNLCTEQKLSYYTAQLLQYDTMSEAGQPVAEPNWDELRAFRDELKQRVDSNGGVKFYSGSYQPSAWLSARVYEASPLWAKYDLDLGYEIWGKAIEYAYNRMRSRCPDRCWDGKEQYIMYLAFQHDPLRQQVLDRLEYLSGRTNSTEAKLWFVQLIQDVKQAGHEVSPKVMDREKEVFIQLQEKLKARDRYVFWSESNGGYYSQDERLTALMLRLLLDKGELEEYYPQVVRYLTQTKNTRLSSATAYRILDGVRRYSIAYPSPKTALDYQLNVDDMPLTGTIADATIMQEHRTALPPKQTVSVTAQPSAQGAYYTEMELEEVFRADDLRATQKGFWIERAYFSVDDAEMLTPITTFAAGQNYIVRLRFVTNTNHRQVLLKDPLLGGFELMHFQLDNADESLRSQVTDGDDQARNCWGWCGPTWSHIEYDLDEIRFSADHISAGTHEVTYAVKARIPGVYDALSSEILEMYNPEVFATNDGARLEITP